ncbi:T9SS type B sorting domain-containing protein [Paracnuella aquatica]|uniref:T9SS type B sorting domain-containing protein n=1 Tax=Paracnuella aquatica TaxID=2268757 RepID=UPI000F4D92FD|nr:gliding motility-associated C-terminal domain-containing protein [Paracnuella aquatica]RPD44808.1 gliding motility-associated C-terminal domain-containing protein [Paracnuella aquatica]
MTTLCSRATALCCYLLFFLLCTGLVASAQPANDACASAQTITIPEGGYKLGKFLSTDVDISKATKQTGETFAPAILVASQTDKTIWFKFSTPTTRSVRVTLKQPGIAIAAGDVGFTVYKTKSCVPANTEISDKLTPIALFGETFHPCVEPGEYLVQVSAKNSANGVLSVQLELGEGSPAPYDKPSGAYEFGKLTNYVTHVDYEVECQSVDDAAEFCQVGTKKMDFTRSTWHTFTTPAYFDYLSVMLARHEYGTPKNVFGYRLYKGNAKTTAPSSLTAVGGCDSLVTEHYYADYKTYKCGELEPNTTYTVQLFYKEEFNAKVRLAIAFGGVAPTKGPEAVLSKVAAANKLGNLKVDANGETTTATDYLACNSRHAQHPCAYAQPSAGVEANGRKYNLSTFFTFTLTTTSKVNFTGSSSWCENGTYLLRLYNKNLTADCKTLTKDDMVTEFVYNATVECLPAGTYTLQVLGTDTVVSRKIYYASMGNSTNPLCLQTHLGTRVDLNMQVYSLQPVNKFSLRNKDAFDAINKVAGVMKALTPGVEYKAVADTFGCEPTVLPDSVNCATSHSATATKAMYREFLVQDSGIVNFTNQRWQLRYKLFEGAADQLAASQNAFTFPKILKGLDKHTECVTHQNCYGTRACVVPGAYTYVSFGGDGDVGVADQPNIQLQKVATRFNAPAKAQNMGSLLDSSKKYGNTLVSLEDRFDCFDNAITIDGLAPLKIGDFTATKAIYRQFYLEKATSVQIYNSHYAECGWTQTGKMRLFTGKATDGVAGLNLAGSQWNGFNNQASGNGGRCGTLPAGWYTVVTYGVGPSYSEPLRDVTHNGYGGDIFQSDKVTIVITQPCEDPDYNRPHKAAVDAATKKPFQIKWGSRVGSTAAYPRTDTTYTLPTEYFDCSVDTAHFYAAACNNSVNRIAYYVFQTTQEAYVAIRTNNYFGAVYDLDVRKDSVAMKTATPIQTCLSSDGLIELCKLQPGTYTLVIFAGDNHICSSVTPRIYVDQVGYSRFDHAAKAYDFGVLTADSAWHKGKKGDVNPLNSGRAPSNDFFYCTTGAQERDPVDMACYTSYAPAIYTAGNNAGLYTQPTSPGSPYIPRRNLWYTFVVDKGGWVHVKVKNKTAGKAHQYGYAVYKSDVDGSLPFDQVVANGQVDSTLAKGLTFLERNNSTYYCYGTEEIKFYRDPCNTTPERYYIVVENRNPWWYGHQFEMYPNSQVEVELLLDSINSVAAKFDHYSTAGDMGLIAPGKIVKGPKDNYSCATADETDPKSHGYQSCATRTLWYKFTVNVTGNIRYRIRTNKPYDGYYYNDVNLYREAIKGDSTDKGLERETYTSTIYQDGSYWGQTCVTKGTYYLFLTGCNRLNEEVYPEIEIIEQAGDFCSAPLVAKVTGAGQSDAKVIVDCHTIGTDYGEFGPKLTCPAGVETSKYKSSWFRIDITGKDTLDVTAFIVENTNAASSDIKYRMMTGDCGAMQEQSCVQDALTQNTYECLAPGRSYFIQVLTPVLKNGAVVTGDITLKLNAIKHLAKCSPPPPCLVNANFQTEFDCLKDTAVRLVNFSTYGSSIKYSWDFGYNNKTSDEVSPAHFFPALPTDKNYKVRLIVENTTCGEKDTTEATVMVPGRPYLNLGEDLNLCTPGSEVTLRATSHKDATYWWNYGGTDSLFKVQGTGYRQIIGKVTYKGCVATDTVNVYISGLQKKPLQNLLLCGETVSLSGYHGQGEQQYKWSTGETGSSISVRQPGTYWVELKAYGCSIRDSFVVATAEDARPLGSDTTLCFTAAGHTLNATLGGASGYRWDNGATGATRKITQGGTYWVDITVSNCTLRDSIVVGETIPPQTTITGNTNLCAGDSVQLDAGNGFAGYLWSSGETTQKIWVKAGGSFKVSVRNDAGCWAESPAKTITQRAKPQPRITGNQPLCEGSAIQLDGGAGFASYAWSSGETTRTVSTAQTGKLRLQVTDANGCTSVDSVLVAPSPAAKINTIIASICAGQTYALPSGVVVAATGNYNDTVRNVSGCDSIITKLNLAVNAAYDLRINAAICSGNTYTLPSGKVVDKAGTYREAFTTRAGCDSIITTVLTIADVLRSTQNATICAGQTFKLPGGRIVITAGTYIDSFKTAGGCDSVAITQLIVNPLPTVTRSVIICEGGSSRLPSGRVVQTAGTFVDTIANSTGCDSVITTRLTVQTLKRQDVSRQICAGTEYVLPSGRKITASGNYIDTVRTTIGCDSLITRLNLVVYDVKREQLSHSMCAGKTYTLPSGRVLRNTGIYQDTLRNFMGCDSLITTMNMTVTPRAPFGVNPANPQICIGASTTMTAYGGDTYQWLPAPGLINLASPTQTVRPNVTTSYKVVITNTVCGLTDTVTTTVVVNPLPTVTVAKSNDVNCIIGVSKLAATGGATYLWTPATGLNNPRLANPVAAPSSTTLYTVRVTTDKGCSAESSVQVVVAPGPGEYNLPNAFTPNGDGMNDCFGVATWGAVKDLQLSIYSRWGNLVYQTNDPTQCWDGTFKGQKMRSEVFVYQLRATTNCGPVYRKGTVTLIR